MPDATAPLLVFDGRLGVADQACHIPHRFEVPPGTGTLRLRFTHAPAHPGEGRPPHQLSISVYGPAGPRGTRHNAADQSPAISHLAATPGFLPGAIEPGQWCVEIDVHRLLPPGGVAYTLEVRCEAEALPAPQPLPAAGPAPRPTADGWYRGDLHGHTLHSDGAMTVAEYAAHARARRQDFVGLTDHNTVSGLPELQARAGGMVVLGGVELTGFHGHGLVLGTRRWQDWRVPDGRTMAGMVRAHLAEGHVFVIAHPMHPGHPWCTGCTWAHADVWPGPARHVEVWNGPWAKGLHNELGLRLYHQWLSAGHRLVATAGSDIHRPWPDGLAVPQMAIRAAAPTEAALLEGLRRGHAFLTAGPTLHLTAEQPGGATALMGDLLPAGPTMLHARWSGAPAGAVARLLVDGASAATAPAPAAGALAVAQEGGGRSWALAELRDPEGGMLAMTNPVFLGDWPHPAAPARP